jgi:curved DNA-binding protein CbpA
MNPYLVLGVSRDANDARIRRAYLDAVRQSPPELHPDRFKQVATAYEKIKDEPSRCRYDLFDMECPGDSPFDALLRHARLTVPSAPLSFEAMKEYLRACAKP